MFSINAEAKRYGSKPYPMISEDGSIYGWVGDGWYYMDKNGMLVGRRFPTEEACKANRDAIVANKIDL